MLIKLHIRAYILVALRSKTITSVALRIKVFTHVVRYIRLRRAMRLAWKERKKKLGCRESLITALRVISDPPVN